MISVNGDIMKFIIASNNSKKLFELERILKPLGVEAFTAKQLGVSLDDVEENGSSFAENAYIKAEAACKKTGLPAIADDSGLCVDALDGRPGIYSARYGGEGATDTDKINKLLSELNGVPSEKRGASFFCSICCIFPDGYKITAEGECKGSIAGAPSGSSGFGYDPIFLYEGKSFAELSADEKDKISHRGNALRELKVKLTEYLGGKNADR